MSVWVVHDRIAPRLIVLLVEVLAPTVKEEFGKTKFAMLTAWQRTQQRAITLPRPSTLADIIAGFVVSTLPGPGTTITRVASNKSGQNGG